MTQKIQDAINAQIRTEFHAAYIYLAMGARLEEMGFSGFANWMRVQWQEETMHAMKLFDFMHQRDGSVELRDLGGPVITFDTPLEAFEEVLKHEKHVTASIHNLYALAVKERDYPLQMLMQWYIDEQVEEEDNARTLIDSLRLIGDSGQGLFVLDRELGQRSLDEEEAA